MEEEKKITRQQEWERLHVERTTILTSMEKDKDGYTLKARFREAAACDGKSINAWIVDTITDRLNGYDDPGLIDDNIREALFIAKCQTEGSREPVSRWLLEAAREHQQTIEKWKAQERSNMNRK